MTVRSGAINFAFNSDVDVTETGHAAVEGQTVDIDDLESFTYSATKWPPSNSATLFVTYYYPHCPMTSANS